MVITILINLIKKFNLLTMNMYCHYWSCTSSRHFRKREPCL
ncbi:hypothetical protein IIV6-T1_043 [Invertebrate iridescent virus 6]|nr:hypothetical protein IIV6-T1_043 [Invertebrate iridescent virus 6]